jgi:hypothetical protein
VQVLKPSREVGWVAFESYLTIREADIFQTGGAGDEWSKPFPDFVRNDDLRFEGKQPLGGFRVSRVVGVALEIVFAPFL